MRNRTCSFLLFLLFSLLVMTFSLKVEAQKCKPSGKSKGKKPPKGQCNQQNDSDCCKEGKYYDVYKCSPKVSAKTKAVLTINGFGKGDGEHGKYHSNDKLIVALSSGWFNKMKRCFKNITIHGNGKSVNAMVVDECDSTMGCDKEHDYQPPCPNYIVDASKAVWKALGVPKRTGVKWISTGLMLDQ
ncbi:hypothetical protein CDL12_04453 [Handroanthus impetiginosus]|uniref:RlpA-like protein double-psi beta-barrel domain-containing protein n=1 Tax=Handroanthus impetiginosus TaxID=429701 RepID=A0A2G9HZB6_9LAMI|nr:hypothetical protein CDL12_04453 [Handroanthus impetiginosus]